MIASGTIQMAFAAALLTSSAAVAQDEVREGDRVRVTLASRVAPAPLVGELIHATADSLVVEREEGGRRTVRPHEMDRLEVSAGLHPRRGSGTFDNILGSAPFLVPVIVAMPIVLTKSEVGSGAVIFGIGLVAIAGASTMDGLLGDDPEEAWAPAAWPAVRQLPPELPQ